MTKNAPILIAAEEEAERHAGLLALREDYDRILSGDEDDEDEGPEVVLGVMPVWPKGSRGARIRAGHVYGDEVEVHDDLRRQMERYQRRVTSFDEPFQRLSYLNSLAAAEADYLLWMNTADWIDCYGIPLYRSDFDPVTGTYPDKMRLG